MDPFGGLFFCLRGERPVKMDYAQAEIKANALEQTPRHVCLSVFVVPNLNAAKFVAEQQAVLRQEAIRGPRERALIQPRVEERLPGGTELMVFLLHAVSLPKRKDPGEIVPRSFSFMLFPSWLLLPPLQVVPCFCRRASLDKLA